MLKAAVQIPHPIIPPPLTHTQTHSPRTHTQKCDEIVFPYWLKYYSEHLMYFLSLFFFLKKEIKDHLFTFSFSLVRSNIFLDVYVQWILGITNIRVDTEGPAKDQRHLHTTTEGSKPIKLTGRITIDCTG